MAYEAEHFAVCDDEDGREISYFADFFDAAAAAKNAHIATARDFYVQPLKGRLPKQFTSRSLDEAAQDLAFETARLSNLCRSANTAKQFSFILGFARDLARDYLAASLPVPAAVATAAKAARISLGLKI